MYLQQGISSPVISVKNEHALHHKLPSSIKQTQTVFSSINSGNGYACGCRKSSSLKLELLNLIKIKEFGEVVPSWVSASSSGSSTRTIRGFITKSKISGTDFPLKPWHQSYDWNIYVKTDPQFFYLNSPVNKEYNASKQTAIMECEWETAFLPHWAWPMPQDRVQITGRWIFDCGHAKNGKHRSEIHPPKAIISFREETEHFYGNKGRSRANQAIVSINEKGGYINQKIGSQNYSFDLHLPPKPSVKSIPKFKIRLSNGNKHIKPIITAFPVEDQKLLRVTIPLKGQKSIKYYGAIISGGWSDPNGIDAKYIKKVVVNVKEVFFKENKDPDHWYHKDKDEWCLYVGVNGRWKFLNKKDKGRRKIDHKVEFYLYKNQKIKISTNGYESDPVNNLMGVKTGLSRKVTSSSRLTSNGRKNAGKKIVKGFRKLKPRDYAWGENDTIGMIDFQTPVNHSKKHFGKIIKSDRNDYEIIVDLL